MIDKPFPITKREAELLHAIGWESGFGWEDQFDWYTRSDDGPPIFAEDDPGVMHEFLSNLEAIRAEAAEARRKERLGTAGEDLLRRLKEATDLLDAIMAEEQLPGSMRPETAVLIEYSRTAIAKAEGSET